MKKNHIMHDNNDDDEQYNWPTQQLLLLLLLIQQFSNPLLLLLYHKQLMMTIIDEIRLMPNNKIKRSRWWRWWIPWIIWIRFGDHCYEGERDSFFSEFIFFQPILSLSFVQHNLNQLYHRKSYFNLIRIKSFFLFHSTSTSSHS